MAREQPRHVTGIWLMIAKKQSGVETVTYDDAVDEALCFGWIDGQKAKYDDTRTTSCRPTPADEPGEPVVGRLSSVIQWST